MKRVLLFAGLLLFGRAAHAVGPLECMASDGVAWKAFSFRVEIEAGHCGRVVELPLGLFPDAYQLVEGPEAFPGRTVCHWRWIPSRGRLLPEGNEPSALRCTLFHERAAL